MKKKLGNLSSFANIVEDSFFEAIVFLCGVTMGGVVTNAVFCVISYVNAIHPNRHMIKDIFRSSSQKNLSTELKLI